jgi:hypothetical protein
MGQQAANVYVTTVGEERQPQLASPPKDHLLRRLQSPLPFPLRPALAALQ